jgi:hypothetical protein
MEDERPNAKRNVRENTFAKWVREQTREKSPEEQIRPLIRRTHEAIDVQVVQRYTHMSTEPIKTGTANTRYWQAGRKAEIVAI